MIWFWYPKWCSYKVSCGFLVMLLTCLWSRARPSTQRKEPKKDMQYLYLKKDTLGIACPSPLAIPWVSWTSIPLCVSFWFRLSLARTKKNKTKQNMNLKQEKSKPFPVNSLVYSFVPAFHCSTRYHGKTDLILVISWSWDGNVFVRARQERITHEWLVLPCGQGYLVSAYAASKPGINMCTR